MDGQPVTGNAAGIKNTLSKIGAWAKKNPIPAGIIVVVLVVVGWLIYKYFGSQSFGSASAIVDPNASGTNLDQTGTGGLTTSAADGGPSFLPPTPLPVISDTGSASAISPIDYSGFMASGAGLPIPSIDSFSIPTASPINTDANATFTNPAGTSLTDYLNSVTASSPSVTNIKSGMDKTRQSSPQWYDYRDPSTYNLPHNPDGSGRPPKGWLPSVGNAAPIVIDRAVSQNVDASMLIPGGGYYNGVKTGGKTGISIMSSGTGSRAQVR